MTSSSRPQSRAVAAGTAAGLRHLERVYVAKVNAAIADDNTDLAHELADDHRSEREHVAGEPARTLIAC